MTRKIILCLALVLAGSGCSRKAVLHKYYLIELPAPADSTAVTAAPITEASCEILPVKIHPAFAGDRIAVRMHTHELAYYAYHKWAVRPGETLTQLVENYLHERRIFAAASRRLWQLIPDFELHTRIHQLEVVRENGRLFAHLNIEFTLIENTTKQIAARHEANEKIRLMRNDLNLFAAAISASFYSELKNFTEKITRYLKNTDAKLSGKS